ncbi:transmembrane protein, putative (macronuclear) [Tetrahymena thermophila SB210]|uniref:Transmembrane protein, putative n=1 Tax=Tetrahymena thermophila (strain SB210) TaxID=312017 RepID=W7X512_TETTS|nr:transmembrane protein, putative [Tetrahymena thermophila SB210]EWS74440.1 transmembrane protein, putative [Tetrahymena thermophila SB210]|eukprot:XP_012653017.1 transmembrane protein, putative [Tetrahymena thermophila SB210]
MNIFRRIKFINCGKVVNFSFTQQKINSLMYQKKLYLISAVVLAYQAFIAQQITVKKPYQQIFKIASFRKLLNKTFPQIKIQLIKNTQTKHNKIGTLLVLTGQIQFKNLQNTSLYQTNLMLYL